MDVAFSEVQAKVNQVVSGLPANADTPIIGKVGTNSNPILWLTLQGDRTVQQLNQYASNVLKKKLETIDGVGEVRLGGKRERTLRVNLSPAKMAAFNIASQDVLNAFNQQHIQIPGGFLVGAKTEKMLKLDLEFHKPSDLEKIIVAYRDNVPVYLKDIATIEDGLEDPRQLAQFNGKPAVGLGVVKIANTNTVAIVEKVKQVLATEINPSLPAGLMVSIASEDASYIQELVSTLQEHCIEGTLFAALVVLLFLGSWRATLIVAIAIPISLLGAIAAAYFLGFTFNAMTLLALLLLIGVVVDDAIVVVENIYRQKAVENDPKKAAILGANQVFFAVLAASLSLVSIFAPVIFLQGIIGKFFQAFSVVVTVGVLASLFVSLTLTPMLCSRYLTLPTQRGKIHNKIENYFSSVEKFYQKWLAIALAHRWKVVALTIVIVFSSGYFFSHVGKEFAPEEDESRYLVTFRAPLGMNLANSQEKLQQIEAVIKKHPENIKYFSAIGLGSSGQVNQGMVYVTMSLPHERKISQQKLLVNLRDELAAIPGIQAFAGPLSIIGDQRGEPLQFAIVGPNLSEVAKISKHFQNQLTKFPELGRFDLDLQLELPQLSLEVDRVRAAHLGIPASEVALALSVMAGGVDYAKFNDSTGDGERYNIRLKANDGMFTTDKDLSKIYLRSAKGDLVRFDTLAHFNTTVGSAVINRFDLQYAAYFYATPTMALGDALEKVKEESKSILPAGYQIHFIGEAEEFAKTAGYMGFVFLMALTFLYIVLASQFNSFVQPLVIMVAQPLAIIGGVFALWLTGHSLNIFSMIGLVLLMGLVAKNSILLIDKTNQLREEGVELTPALMSACPERLRPILMTSLTIIFALFPAAIGVGSGAATNAPLAVAVIGGMITSTLLSLVVVPAVYSLVEEGLFKKPIALIMHFYKLIFKPRHLIRP